MRDVLNLIPLARSLGYIDMHHVFMLGWSRGGMMTYLTLQYHMPVNAVAVGGGLTDLVSEGKRRPALANDDHGLSLNKADSDRRIVAWFRRHMK